MTASTIRIPIFRAGTHVAADGRRITFSRADLQEVADSYNPALQRAPHVIGHPELDAPAWGWAASLSVDGDVLIAESDQVEPQFAQMVNDGRFPNRSASFYLATTPGNPTPGRKYLKHVGWLGAAPPAVSGLGAVKFSSDSAEALSFSFPASFAAHTQKEPTVMDQAELERQQADLKRQQDELTASRQQLATDQATLASGQKALDDAQRAAARQDVAQFAQQLEKDGKLLPAETAPVVELLLSLPADNAPLSFSQAGTTVSKPAAAVLRGLLSSLPKRIDYVEKSADASGGNAAVSFAAPTGSLVDTSRSELHARALQLQAKNAGMSYVDAVRSLGG